MSPSGFATINPATGEEIEFFAFFEAMAPFFFRLAFALVRQPLNFLFLFGCVFLI